MDYLAASAFTFSGYQMWKVPDGGVTKPGGVLVRFPERAIPRSGCARYDKSTVLIGDTTSGRIAICNLRDATGDLNRSFADRGVASHLPMFARLNGSRWSQVAPANDERLYAVGSFTTTGPSSTESKGVILRLQPNGAPDETFGEAGWVPVEKKDAAVQLSSVVAFTHRNVQYRRASGSVRKADNTVTVGAWAFSDTGAIDDSFPGETIEQETSWDANALGSYIAPAVLCFSVGHARQPPTSRRRPVEFAGRPTVEALPERLTLNKGADKQRFMIMSRLCASILMSLSVVACASTGTMPPVDAPEAASGVGAPAAPVDDIEKARLIERTLLMSDLFVIGMRERVQRDLAGQEGASELADCLEEKMDPVASDMMAQHIKEAATPEQLDLGARLASAPVFGRINRYILENRDSLRREALAAGGRADHYFLRAAASRLDISESDRSSVSEFIAWHEEIIPTFNQGVEAMVEAIFSRGRDAVKECVEQFSD